MPFARPKRTHSPPAWGAASAPEMPPPAAEPPPGLEAGTATGPSPAGSAFALFGLLCTAGAMFGDKPETLARSAAYGVGLSLALTLIADARGGIRNLLRADVLAIVALYVLTLFEFLFPQPEFNRITDLPSTHGAIVACLWGMAALIVGRHLRAGGQKSLSALLKRPVPVGWLVVIFLISLLLGIFHMLLAVNFNFFEMLAWCTGPRFSQPWSRGRLGDWRTLLNELAMLLYLIPPITGIAYARVRKFNSAQLAIITAGFTLVMFIGFSSGTRNLFISYLLTFMIGYIFALPKGRHVALMVCLSICAAAAMLGSAFMLQFRNIGLKDWVIGRLPRGYAGERVIHVDMNLYVISQLVAIFPAQQKFLGLEVPYLALIRPIPRALWPGKPEGMSISMEEASGAEESWTVAASFVGEAYVAGGIPIVILTGLFFGFGCAWWSRLASAENSEVGILVYASGFFAAAISMRSLFVFTTAVLPTIAAILMVRYLVKRIAAQASQLLRAGRGRPAMPLGPAPRFPRRRG